MQKIGDITDTADNNGEFTDGNVAGNVQPTELMAAWFNTVQRELISVLSAAGIDPDRADDAQLATAIRHMIDNGVSGSGYLIAENNLSDIANPVEAKKNLDISAATVQKPGLVQLSSNANATDEVTAVTPKALNAVLRLAVTAQQTADSKYTAAGATTAAAGLVQLADKTGGSGALVMTQAAVTQAINAVSLRFGVGQRWQNMISSRRSGVNYTNSTGLPIAVAISETTDSDCTLIVDGVTVGRSTGINVDTSFFTIVPDGSAYSFTGSIATWAELR